MVEKIPSGYNLKVYTEKQRGTSGGVYLDL